MMVLLSTMALVLVLVALSAIDAWTRRLPDWLTLPLLALGLAVTSAIEPEQLLPHVFAAVLGFASFWLVAVLYRRYRGFDGLGLGDAKLLAAAGAWLGPFYLAPMVLAAALLALAAVLVLRVAGRPVSLQSSLPFGPFLSAGFLGLWWFKTMAEGGML